MPKRLLSIDSLRERAIEEYALFRDSWLQRRNCQIGEDREKSDDENLPDHLLEEEGPSVPIDAMAMIVPTPAGWVRGEGRVRRAIALQTSA